MYFLIHLLLFCLLGLQLQHYWPSLPAHIATHFGTAGAPVNGWVPKRDFLYFYAGLGFCLPLVSTCASMLSFRFLPARFINIPNRRYWLAPERRDETIKRLTRDMKLLSYAIQMYIIAVGQIVITANLETPPHINAMAIGAVMGGMITFIVAFIIRRLRTYRLPPAQP